LFPRQKHDYQGDVRPTDVTLHTDGTETVKLYVFVMPLLEHDHAAGEVTPVEVAATAVRLAPVASYANVATEGAILIIWHSEMAIGAQFWSTGVTCTVCPLGTVTMVGDGQAACALAAPSNSAAPAKTVESFIVFPYRPIRTPAKISHARADILRYSPRAAA
jgi:hypothetical protein